MSKVDTAVVVLPAMLRQQSWVQQEPEQSMAEC